jgi:flagellar biosynthesis protein FlhB
MIILACLFINITIVTTVRTFQSDLMHETMEIIQGQNEGHMLDVGYDIIYLTAIGLTLVAVVQYTFTHEQYLEKHTGHKQCIEQHSSLIRKNADRAPSLRGIPWHLLYN